MTLFVEADFAWKKKEKKENKQKNTHEYKVSPNFSE